ncbi:MAG: hypothetical protein AB8I08_06755 [Sandaracinaceae bacterium]
MSRVCLVLMLFGGCAPEAARAPAPQAMEATPTESTRTEAVAPEGPLGQPGPWDEELTLGEAAFDTPGPSVIVHAPPNFDPAAPLDVVVFLHGWSGCARVLAASGQVACADGTPTREGWGLNAVFDRSGSRALFVVPQLAWLARDGAAGRFRERGGFDRFLTATLAALQHRLGAPGGIRRITLLAHSAGFETALAIVQRGGVEVNHVVLFDALYRGVEPFLAWAGDDADRRLVSLYTGSARTASQSRRLGALARRQLDSDAVAMDLDAPLPEQLCGHRVVVARGRAPHADVPARHLTEVMGGLESARSGVCSDAP